MPEQTPLRAIRIPDELWDAARDKARTEGRGVSEVMREYLAKWVTRPPRQSQG